MNCNSENELSMTTPLRLRPFVVIAFMYGFDGNTILCCSIEQQWKVHMHRLRRNGITNAK